MTEMVERVARAIAGYEWGEEGFQIETKEDAEEREFATGVGARVISREEFRDMARAAIAAMREPSEAMIDAPVADSIDFGEGDDHRVIWRKMIDAALEDGR